MPETTVSVFARLNPHYKGLLERNSGALKLRKNISDSINEFSQGKIERNTFFKGEGEPEASRMEMGYIQVVVRHLDFLGGFWVLKSDV